ncbi:hypothetical protein PHYSODRAFT_302861 [Phytophthora sojae]|uniref:Uncharacterized protein n=1 Tax=Phytophthora sojae (strain P6497) TaxID=1094619 RepID=G4ZTG1_PHYSP|nr:hypothetical protein PHYSODRAFT_302861 [Phytophthora sojae]EGZ13139.1 hypothetical protein PHYSODRAFT_302861 [Phytophthora sojae]|eukprot:XP_009530568.1 hypothetical protein PHYSODRAFT_302861 [Phytophthora sojae]
MESDWTFLDPWLSTLWGSVLGCGEPELERVLSDQQIILSPLYPKAKNVEENVIYVKISVDEVHRHDRKHLQHLREAIELVSAVAIVDNAAFQQLMSVEPDEACTHHPKWIFCIFGTLSPQDPAATQYHVSFGTLLGFPKDPWVDSAEFKKAMDNLEAMGLKEAVKLYNFSEFTIDWLTENSTGNIGGRYCPALCDVPRPLSTHLKKLFDSDVPPVVQLHATGNAASVVKRLQETRVVLKYPLSATPAAQLCDGSNGDQPVLHPTIYAFNLDFSESGIPELTTALARTAIQYFSLGYRKYDMVDTAQSVMSAGYLLSTLVSGRSICGVTLGDLSFPSIARNVEYGLLDLNCDWAPDGVFAATCSAVAELSSIRKVDWLGFSRTQSPTQNRLSWVLYALCCGSLSVSIGTLQCEGVSLTKPALTAAKATLQNKFPGVIQDQGSVNLPKYGFVELKQGAQIQLVLPNGEETVLEVSSPYRCRARYDPFSSPELVDAVVPGYGVCKVILRDEVSEFVRDGQGNSVLSRALWNSIRSLTFSFESVEVGALVTDLLGLICWRVKSLFVRKRKTERDPTTQPVLDLSILSEVCPDLEELNIIGFNVVVGSRSHALRTWRIRKIEIYGSTIVPDLGPCLDNPSYQMARGLAILTVSASYQWEYDINEMLALNSHDGDYLALTKNRLPSESKAALISVVKSRRQRKAVNLLDVLCLSRIFAFVSTPVRRSVRCHK